MTIANNLIKKRAITGIGSLPHHNIDAALAYSFEHDIPFLPQIPRRNPWEFMLAQALEGLPGIEVDKEGTVHLNENVWLGRSFSFSQKLNHAFEQSSKDLDAFSAFEPSSATSSCWQPFLWEIEERGTKVAKAQLAGPLTVQWVLKNPEITFQVYRLILARALSMTRRIQSTGAQPVFYFDEPGLYCYSSTNPLHIVALKELKLVVQTLQKEKVIVGIHCCSNTDWGAVINLGVDIVSLDTGLSLNSLLQNHGPAAMRFIKDGGRFSLGIIPTNRATSDLLELRIGGLIADLRNNIAQFFEHKESTIEEFLDSSIYTPACGLALQSIESSESILQLLKHVKDFYAF